MFTQSIMSSNLRHLPTNAASLPPPAEAQKSPIFKRLLSMSSKDVGEAAADFDEDVELDEIPEKFKRAQRYARMIQQNPGWRAPIEAQKSPIFKRLLSMSPKDVEEAAADFDEDVELDEIPEKFKRAQHYARMIQQNPWWQTAKGQKKGSNAGSNKVRRRFVSAARSRRRRVRTRRSKAKGRSSKQRKSTRRRKGVRRF